MSPEEMEKIPQKIEQMMYGLQQRIMEDVVRRIQIAGEITSTTDYLINKYRLLGGTTEFIESEIKRLTGLTDLEIQRIYEKVITEAYARNEGIYTKLNAEFIPYEENDELQILVSSIINQTKNELSNITGSMGFMVDYGVKKVFTPISEYYQKYLDNACMDIVSGAYDYGSVLRRVVKQMTASGIRTVDYASGYSNRATVAARRAVMTGVHQLNAKINEQTAKDLGTDTYEVTWHSGHRAEHWWGGKVFSYKELVSVCGLGTVTGLCGANCYHSYNAFIPGISVRTYSDQQLEEMEAREKIERNWQGKSYNAYQATQKQRQMETQMRKYREDISLLKKSGGNAEDISASQARYINTLRQYREFSKRMELPEQMERVYIDGLGRVTKSGKPVATARKLEKNGKNIAKEKDSVIIESANTKEVKDVHSIGRIDKNIYRCITEEIITDEVVITDERIQHIKERHPNDYERFRSYMADIILEPDYIIKANKPNTATILKEITDNGQKFQLVLRIITPEDNPKFKNSVITFLNINERTWNKYLRNKEILYKRE